MVSSLPVEMEQHELEPEDVGATGPEPDEMAVEDEDDGDDDVTIRESLTADQRVILNIHNNCGHPTKEEFFRALRLSRDWGSSTLCDGSSSVQHVQLRDTLQSQAKASSSVAADPPLQRDTRCGSLRSRIARWHQDYLL